MRKAILFISFMLLVNRFAFGQKDTLSIQKINRTNINYKSYVTIGHRLYALNDSGKLVIWDLNKLDTIPFTSNRASIKYTAIAEDRNDEVFLGTSTGQILKIDSSDLTCSLFLKTKYTIKYMCFNSSNKLFLIVPNAVYDPISKRHWNNFDNHTVGLVVTKRFLIFFKKKIKKYFSIPQYTFLDNEGKWWMIAVYGEFGGALEIFDTQNEVIVNNKFDDVNPGNLFPRSVFEDDQQNIYLTSGLQHFMNFGDIYKIQKDRTITKIFDGVIKPDTVKKKGDFDNGKDFIGPGAYNKYDKHIYFATSTGFYKSDVTGDKIKPEFLFNTNFSWSREPLAVGSDMPIRKLDFTTDNKFFFMTENDGFAIYDGKKIVFLK